MLKALHIKEIIKQIFSICFLFTILITSAQAQTIYYVDSANGDDANPGISWGTAFRNISRAITAANTSSAAEIDIWVAAGTYRPTDGITNLPTDNSDTSFTFYRGNGVGKALKVYGGFAGTETNIAQRDTSVHTYLDGNIGNSLSSYHVVMIAGLVAASDSVVIDGFTIRYGYGSNYMPKTYNGISIDIESGGGMYLGSDSTDKLVIRNCSFISNSSYSHGGGMYLTYSEALITNCSFISNQSFVYGAGIYAFYSSPIINECVFTANIVNANSYQVAYGGGIYDLVSSPIITKCTFTLNSAFGNGNVHGGALCNVTSTCIIDSCIFNSNTALVSGSGYAYGGGIYNNASSTITNCSFINNTCHSYGNEYTPGGTSYGGGLYNAEATTTLDGCNFISNGAFGYAYDGEYGPTSGYGYGGAIFNSVASLIITNCDFTSDSAYGYGGAGVGSSGFGYGGGICSSSYPSPTNVTLDSCKFTANVSVNDAGAIYLYTGNIVAAHCVFDSNQSGAGGAIRAGDVGPGASGITCYDNVFANNVATAAGGGAISTYLNGGPDTLINNLFVFNKDLSGTGGGALNMAGSSHYIANNTFYEDSAINGGAIYGYSGYIYTVANNIFNNNHGTDSADTYISTYSIYSSHNLYSITNPQFIDTSNLLGNDGVWRTADDGLQLQGCSPARNAGSDSFVVTGETMDITGATRIEGPSVDIGAYEVNPFITIYGPATVCTGHTAALTDSTAGGIWISADTAIATINSTGAVTGLTAGIDTIDYVITYACGTDTAKFAITVNDTANAGIITGNTTICMGAYTVLTDSLPDGTWSIGNNNAAINNGIVTGLIAGTDTVTYTNSCGTATTNAIITINPLPTAGSIAGETTICTGATTALTDTAQNGTWASINQNIATINATGAVTAVSQGTGLITYTVTNECGTSIDTSAVTVQQNATAIVGQDSFCAGLIILLTDSTVSGIWSSSNPAIAAIDSMGLVTGMLGGIDTISYTITNSCGTSGAIKTIQILASPNAGSITGDTIICSGTTIQLNDTIQNGAWSSINPAIAIVDTAGSITGVSQGATNIVYTVTNECGIASDTATISVQQIAATIGGMDSVCPEATILLTDSTTSGTWSSASVSVATIDNAGLVTSIAEGIDTISYSVTNVCGNSNAIHTVKVIALPNPSMITGPTNVCPDSSITLSDSVLGGLWTAMNENSIINASYGEVEGITPGSNTIYYTISNFCGTKSDSIVIITDTCALGVSLVNLTSALQIYPNPANNQLIIKVANGAYNSFTITNNIGEIEMVQQLHAPQTIVNVAGLPDGIYFINVNGAAGWSVEKIVIMR